MTVQPLALLNSVTGSVQDLYNARRQVVNDQYTDQMNPLLIQQQQMSNEQMQMQNEGLRSQQNITNTVNRLQELERQIGYGATPEQLAGTLQGFIQQSQASGGNPIDSQQALQVLQTQGVEGLQNLLGQAKQVFMNQGYIQAPEAQQDKVGRFKLGDGFVFDSATGSFEPSPEFAQELEKSANAASLNDLRGVNSDVSKIQTDARAIYGSAKDLDSLASAGSASDQLAIVFKFMKALDPTSVVREGEQVQVMKTGGIYDYFQNVIGGLNNGQRLNQEQMNNIVKTAKTLANNAATSSNQQLDGYLDLIGDGLNKKQRENLSKKRINLFDLKENTQQTQTFTTSGGQTVQFTVE